MNALQGLLTTARIGELRRELRGLDVDDALHLMFMELSSPFGPMCGNMGVVEGGLEGTEAGEYLARMRQHARRLAEERAERETYESPEAAAVRRQVKAERKRAEQQARLERKRQREAAIDASLEAFATLEPAEALRGVLDGSAGFPLYRLPAALIEPMIRSLGALGDAELRRLRERVPVNRVQPFARLSRAIDEELRTRAP